MSPQILAVNYIPQYGQVLIAISATAGANAFELSRNAVIVPITLDAAGAYSDEGLINGQVYEYRVRAGITVGAVTTWSAWTDPVGVIPAAITNSTPFATSADLAAYWKTLTPSEITRATSLLNIASARLRLYAAGNNPDLDTRAAGEPGFRSILNWITMEAVKRAMQNPTEGPSVDSYQQTAGIYSENFKYTNPTGDLFFRKSELQALGLSGGQTLDSITPITSSDLYLED